MGSSPTAALVRPARRPAVEEGSHGQNDDDPAQESVGGTSDQFRSGSVPVAAEQQRVGQPHQRPKPK